MRENMSEIVIGEREIQLSLALLPHRNSDHKMYGSEKNHGGLASGLVVHGKTVMGERPPPEIWVSVLLLAVFVAVYMDQDIAHRNPGAMYLPAASAHPYSDARYKSGSNMHLRNTGATLWPKSPSAFCVHLNLR